MSKSNRERGTLGEKDVIRKVRCPNCGKKLRLLPVGFPLFDVQCVACVFRAQVKTNNGSPRNEIFGSGYTVLRHSMAIGQLIPPLIANFVWSEGRSARQLIVFYPMITKRNIRTRKRGAGGSHPGYEEFNYIGMKDAPSQVLYERPQPTRKAS